MLWKNALHDYKHYLKIERGLSQNSILAYSNDVKKLMDYIKEYSIDIDPINIDDKVIQQYIYHAAKNVNAKSQSRQISGLRNFFDFMIFEDYRKNNPTELLESPKIGRTLPDTLSEAEIEEIIAQIDLSKPEGERNKAMLETLYGCGLRVSELVNLKISDLFFDEGFIRIIGKGNKERFVPINLYTIKIINIYKNQLRSKVNIQKDLKILSF